MPELVKWLFNFVATTGILGIFGFLLRDTITKFFSKAVEHRFQQRLEKFKGELRDNERELEQIRSFLVSARRDNDLSIQAKRLQAAEILLRARDGLSEFTTLVEYMKLINTDEILKNGDNPKTTQFIEILIQPFDIEGKIKRYNDFDKALPRLYLNEQTIEAFDAYAAIILHAVFMMKFFAMPLHDKGSFIKKEGLRNIIIELEPNSKEGFDKFGDGYAYYWTKHFHDQILKLLRHEISGAAELRRASNYVEILALDARRAQLNVRTTLEEKGLPKSLLNADQTAASSMVEKATA